MQFASDDETQSPQLSLFLKDLTVKELATPDTYRSDSQKFLFEISPNVGENWSEFNDVCPDFSLCYPATATTFGFC